MAALCVVTFGLAFLSWKYVEQPFRNRHTVGRRAVFAVGAVGSTAFAAVGLVGYQQDGFPSRLDPRTQALRDTSLAALEADLQPCWQKFDDRAEIDAACAIGRADTTSFALLGDSHAGALRAELETWASANGVGGLNYSYRTCPPVRDIQFVSTPSNEDVTCWRLRRSFFAALEAGGPIPDTIVVAARWPLLIEREAIKAREDKQRAINDALACAADVVPKASGRKGRVLAEAKGYKQSSVARAEGDAKRFTLLAEQYRLAPEVTRKRLYLETMEEVLSRTPKILIDGEKGNNMLYLPLDKLVPQATTPERAGAAMSSSEGR